jgi:hypothetical protein
MHPDDGDAWLVLLVGRTKQLPTTTRGHPNHNPHGTMSASSRVAVMLDDKVLVSSAESDLTMVEGSESHLHVDLRLCHPRLTNEGAFIGVPCSQTGTFLNKTWWIDLGSSRATRTPLAVGKVRRRGSPLAALLTRCISLLG